MKVFLFALIIQMKLLRPQRMGLPMNEKYKLILDPPGRFGCQMARIEQVSVNYIKNKISVTFS